MPFVPFDRKQKTELGGFVPESLPSLQWEVPSPLPAPSDWIDPVTGEVYCESVLMCALPWPRFRGFFDGKQVLLPLWAAVTLKRTETEIGLSFHCGCPCNKLREPGSHARIEIHDRKIFSLLYCGNHKFSPSGRPPSAFFQSRKK